MKQEKKNVLRITDTTLRDAHQSLWATRMRTDDILGIAEAIDNAGYYALECWGGSAASRRCARRRRSRCCSAARTCSATATIPTTS